MPCLNAVAPMINFVASGEIVASLRFDVFSSSMLVSERTELVNRNGEQVTS